MIKLTRINGTLFVINAELIEFLESSPDTIVTLSTGHKYLIKDSIDDVIEKVKEYRRSIAGKPLAKE